MSEEKFKKTFRHKKDASHPAGYRSVLVHSQEDLDKLGKEWKETPLDAGVETHPQADTGLDPDQLARKEAGLDPLEETEISTEEVQEGVPKTYTKKSKGK